MVSSKAEGSALGITDLGPLLCPQGYPRSAAALCKVRGPKAESVYIFREL